MEYAVSSLDMKAEEKKVLQALGNGSSFISPQSMCPK